MKQGKSMSGLMDRIREVSRDAENREGYSYLSNMQNVVSGNGYFWEDGIEPVKKPCPVCNGSGKLDAEITIEWKPSKR